MQHAVLASSIVSTLLLLLPLLLPLPLLLAASAAAAAAAASCSTADCDSGSDVGGVAAVFFLRVCFGVCVCWFVGWLPQKLQSKEPAILFGVLCSCTGTISVTLSGPTTHLVKSALAGGDTMVRSYTHVRHYKPKPMSLLCLI